MHLGLFVDDRGYSLQMISLVLAVITLASAAFLLVGGYLGDKFSMRKLAFAFSAMLALSVVLLVLAPGTGTLFAFAILFGMVLGGQTVIMVAMRGRYFGRKAFATITNLSSVPPGILLVATPVVVGIVRDWTGDYDAAFLTLAAISLVGGIAFLMMGEPTQRPRLPAGVEPLGQTPAE